MKESVQNEINQNEINTVIKHESYLEIRNGLCSKCYYMFHGSTMKITDDICSICSKMSKVVPCSHVYWNYCYYGNYEFDQFIVEEPRFPYSDSIREQFENDYSLFEEDERISQYIEDCECWDYNQAAGIKKEPSCLKCKK